MAPSQTNPLKHWPCYYQLQYTTFNRTGNAEIQTKNVSLNWTSAVSSGSLLPKISKSFQPFSCRNHHSFHQKIDRIRFCVCFRFHCYFNNSSAVLCNDWPATYDGCTYWPVHKHISNTKVTSGIAPFLKAQLIQTDLATIKSALACHSWTTVHTLGWKKTIILA